MCFPLNDTFEKPIDQSIRPPSNDHDPVLQPPVQPTAPSHTLSPHSRPPRLPTSLPLPSPAPSLCFSPQYSDGRAARRGGHLLTTAHQLTPLWPPPPRRFAPLSVVPCRCCGCTYAIDQITIIFDVCQHSADVHSAPQPYGIRDFVQAGLD